MADRTSTVRVNVVTDASTAGASLGKFGKLAGVAALGVGAVAVGGALAANKLYDYADAQDDANASITQGLKTMKIFGKQTDEVTQRIIAQAEATSKATGFDITSIKTTQAKLLTFRNLAKTADKTGGAFDRATQAAIDMAAKGFGTAETNAVMLGKALEDPENGLTALKKTGALTAAQIKSIGDEFKRTGDVSAAQGQILAAVEQQVKGTAEATAGGFELMKNRVSLFAQELGAKLLPYMDRFGTFMIERGGPAMMRFGQTIAAVVIPKLRQFAGFIQSNVIPVVNQLIGWIVDHLVPAYKTVLAGALEGARGLFKNVSKSVDDNRKPLADMGDKLKRIATYLVDNVLPVLGDFYKTVLPKVGEVIGTAITQLSNMYTAWSTLWGIITDVAAAIQNVIDKLQAVANSPAGAILGAVTRTATGGASGGLSAALHNGGTVNLNINGIHTDPRGTAREVEKVLRRAGLAGGRAA